MCRCVEVVIFIARAEKCSNSSCKVVLIVKVTILDSNSGNQTLRKAIVYD